MPNVGDAKYTISAENNTQRAFNEISSSIGLVQTSAKALVSTLAAVGASLAVGAIFNASKEFITAAAALDDFGEKTGSAVAKLSELQQVANYHFRFINRSGEVKLMRGSGRLVPASVVNEVNSF